MQEQEIRKKLAQLAKQLGLRRPEVQLLLCQERFLARLGSIPDGRFFVWKGGSLILRLYRIDSLPRYTIDIDLTVSGIPVSSVQSVFSKAMAVNVKDGFTFKSITTEPMQRELPYGGDRFEFEWDFFSKKGSRCLAIDACAGDIVRANTVASADAFLLPLGTENVEFKVYPKEFIFAEKLETVLRFRTGNSRCKDFVDMWMLIRGGIDQSKLSAAIKMCFENRGTPYSLDTLRDVVFDKLFQERLETHRQRHFSELSVPDIKTVMRDLAKFLEIS